MNPTGTLLTLDLYQPGMMKQKLVLWCIGVSTLYQGICIYFELWVCSAGMPGFHTMGRQYTRQMYTSIYSNIICDIIEYCDIFLMIHPGTPKLWHLNFHGDKVDYESLKEIVLGRTLRVHSKCLVILINFNWWKKKKLILYFFQVPYSLIKKRKLKTEPTTRSKKGGKERKKKS